MTIKESITQLKARGYRVSYRQRKDGGVIIKSINGQRFSGAKGNAQARSLLGTTLSVARSAQLERLNPYTIVKTKYVGKDIKGRTRTLTKVTKNWTLQGVERPSWSGKTKLPDVLVKELRKVQRIWRKGHKNVTSPHPTIRGTISMSNLRYAYEQGGEEGAFEKLRKARRYAEGYAYEENIRWYKERLDALIGQLQELGLDTTALEAIVDKLQDSEFIMNFKEDWVSSLHDDMYKLEQQGMMADQEDVDDLVSKFYSTISE